MNASAKSVIIARGAYLFARYMDQPGSIIEASYADDKDTTQETLDWRNFKRDYPAYIEQAKKFQDAMFSAALFHFD